LLDTRKRANSSMCAVIWCPASLPLEAQRVAGFPGRDPVGSYIVFNVGGNRYRLIADVKFQVNLLLVRDVLTRQLHFLSLWIACV
jgi:hypothetical protein